MRDAIHRFPVIISWILWIYDVTDDLDFVAPDESREIFKKRDSTIYKSERCSPRPIYLAELETFGQ